MVIKTHHLIIDEFVAFLQLPQNQHRQDKWILFESYHCANLDF